MQTYTKVHAQDQGQLLEGLNISCAHKTVRSPGCGGLSTEQPNPSQESQNEERPEADQTGHVGRHTSRDGQPADRASIAAGGQLEQIKLSTAFTIYMEQSGEGAVLLALWRVSEEWNKKRDKGEKVGALRIAILQVFLMEAKTRLRVQNPQATAEAKKLGWLDAQGRLQFMLWNHENKKLEPYTQLQPLTVADVDNILQELHDLARPDLITRFCASRPLRTEPQAEDKAVFTIEVALRSEEANRFHALMAQTVGNSVWMLVGAQLKAPGQQRFGLAAALQKLTGRSGAGVQTS